MKDRILKVMEHEGMTPSKFAETIGIQRSAMSHIISGRNNPSLDVLLKVLGHFTYVDTDWLLFGKGEMIRDNGIKEPSLFTNIEENMNEPVSASENSSDPMLNFGINKLQTSENERIIIQNTPTKSINKIMVFYSDNTFDTFVQEKSEKE